MVEAEDSAGWGRVSNIADYIVVGRQPSSDGESSYQITRLIGSDVLLCECKGFGWRGRCRHVIKMTEELANPTPVGILNWRTDMAQLRFIIRFKDGPKVVAEVRGRPQDYNKFQAGDITERIVETEHYLERLTGLRVHIETAEE